MLTLLSRLAALVAVLICLQACGKFDFQGQDLALRHDAVADTIDLELTYRGVRSPTVTTTRKNLETGEQEPGGIDAVCAAIEDVAASKRYFMLFFHSFAFDLDKLSTELREEQTIAPREENRALLALMENISITSATVYVDGDERIGVRQRIHLKGARHAMALLNRSVQAGILEAAESGRFALQTADFLDDATRAALIAEARKGTPWLRWNGSDLICDLPISSASSARLLVGLLAEQTDEEERNVRAFAPALFALVKDLRVEKHRLVMTLTAGEEGSLHMELGQDEREYSDSLLQELRAREFPFAPDPSLGQ